MSRKKQIEMHFSVKIQEICAGQVRFWDTISYNRQSEGYLPIIQWSIDPLGGLIIEQCFLCLLNSSLISEHLRHFLVRKTHQPYRQTCTRCRHIFKSTGDEGDLTEYISVLKIFLWTFINDRQPKQVHLYDDVINRPTDRLPRHLSKWSSTLKNKSHWINREIGKKTNTGNPKMTITKSKNNVKEPHPHVLILEIRRTRGKKICPVNGRALYSVKFVSLPPRKDGLDALKSLILISG